MRSSQNVIEPVVKSVRVNLPVQQAFELFTDGITEWWPLETHSVAADAFEGRVKAERVVFESRAGGRIYEVMSDDRHAVWGSVLEWDPPTRVVLSWKPNLTDGPATEVEVRFAASEGGTKVELEHRGWDRLGAVGPEHRHAYETEWAPVLDLYQAAASLKPECR